MAIAVIDAWSPNYNSRPGPTIDCIVIHDTESDTAADALSWFESPDSGVSAHYVIDRDGSVYRCVPDELRAWHAGASELGGRANVNDFSLGIELVGFATGTYTDAQIDVLVELCVDLCLKYPAITVARIVGHADVATPPGRKTDPGPHFPWATMRARVQFELDRRLA
jgi:N-acetylmuramoyl-L-alanine amidase